MIITGNIYHNGRIIPGTLDLENFRFREGISSNGLYGTLIPAPVNFHTHVGDSFIKEEPRGTIPEIVGPGGLKHRLLDNATDDEIIKYISMTNSFMEESGTVAYVDFREQGIRGINLIKRSAANYIRPVILGRPYNNDNVDDIIKNADGIALSSLNDIDFNTAMECSKKAHSAGKIFAMHFSENVHEDINKILMLKPDFLVHGIEASDSDLDMIGHLRIPIVITPRSNIFYGKRPDYSRYLARGIDLLLGTDNVFVTEPDMFSEMDFLYRYQRFFNYIEPEKVLSMAVETPRRFLYNHNIKIPERYIFFENELLNEYDIITKAHYYKPEILPNIK